MKILDCTFRDGGYYTNWDFSKEIVYSYIAATNVLPIDYLEVGYRNKPAKEYMGKFGYTPVSELEYLKMTSKKKIAVMLNEKDTSKADLDMLLKPVQGLIDMVRIAVDPKNFERALSLAEAIKEYGIEIAFNAMYMSKWVEYESFLNQLNKLNGVVNLFCMVDSFGGVSPKDVRNVYEIVKSSTICQIGFHGHNNLQLGLINTLTAIECGVDFVDATILGMGRGAGNLKMELLLTYLNKHQDLNVDFNVLSELITSFMPLYEKYRWDTSLPYMLSGTNSIPQKEVMEWVTNRTYSFNSIVRAINNKRNNIIDNARFPILPSKNYSEVLIIGGGNTAIEHLDAIKKYIQKKNDIALIFATARHAMYYNELNNDIYYCLVGNEAKRLSKNINKKDFKATCILPPYPRIMGTEVPHFIENSIYELPNVSFIDNYKDSCTTIALQTALHFNAKEISIIGYDGYSGEKLSDKEIGLFNENETIFKEIKRYSKAKIHSLTPSLYKELVVKSIYQDL